MRSTIRGYSSPFNLGHKALAKLFDCERIIVQEKIDGSQFSFGIINGELECRSRNQKIILDDAGMFSLAVATAVDLASQDLLVEGYTYRSEYLMKPKHNTLAYERIPKGNIILFDIDREDQDYLPFNEVAEMARAIDLEHVPTWECIGKPSVELLEVWMQHKSVLEGTLIEGLVFKNYDEFGRDSKVLMGKYVSDKFREVHDKDWKKRNPSAKAFVAVLIEQYATEGRWAKAAQHLSEAGELENEPRDIPKLLKEVNRDVLEECEQEIKDKLFKFKVPKEDRIRAKHPAMSKTLEWERFTDYSIRTTELIAALLRQAQPSLRYVCGHEDVTNRDTLEQKYGGKFDPGPVFPWDQIDWKGLGYTRVRYDFPSRSWVEA